MPAARYLQKIWAQSSVVDWDVHHGNGTQHSFEQDPSILFFSTHQYPHYPGTGRASEHGTGAGEGFTINVPMEAGEGDDEYVPRPLRSCSRLRSSSLDFVIISAGFDAHRDDPLAGMGLTEAGYADLTGLVAGGEAPCSSAILSCLEGGYNLTALAASVDAHLKALLAA